MAEGYGCRSFDALKPLHVRLVLWTVRVYASQVFLGHHENAEHFLDSRLIREPLPRLNTLRTNVLQSFASIEPHDLVRL